MQVFALARLCGLAVIGNARVARTEDEFVGCRIADSASHGNAIFNHGDRDAELRNALHEFARAIEWIDDPHAPLVETGEIVDGLF